MDDPAADRHPACRRKGVPRRPRRSSQQHRELVVGRNQRPVRARAVTLPPHRQRVLMRAAHPSTGFVIVALFALALTLGLCAGCNDDNPTNPAPSFEADRSSPKKLLTQWFEAAYRGENA